MFVLFCGLARIDHGIKFKHPPVLDKRPIWLSESNPNSSVSEFWRVRLTVGTRPDFFETTILWQPPAIGRRVGTLQRISCLGG